MSFKTRLTQKTSQGLSTRPYRPRNVNRAVSNIWATVTDTLARIAKDVLVNFSFKNAKN